MKHFLSLFLTFALLLSLAACRSPAANSPASSAPSPSSASPLPSTSPTSTPLLPVSDDSRYFFVNSCFLGCWDGTQWCSAAGGGFTLGQLFDRDYINVFGESISAVRFFIADGPGAFDDPEHAAALLDPFGIIEGDDFIMKLPGALSGEAADISIPNYNFWTYFDGQAYSLISNVALEQLPISGSNAALSDSAVTLALTNAGITCDLSRMCCSTYTSDVDGDGQQETLALIQNPIDENGYTILEAGDQIFYALLLADRDSLSVVASLCTGYTDDVTAHFRAELQNVCDLDGDGSCEIILQQMEWEWGHFAAYTLQNGQWSECLRGEYGN